MPELDPLSFRHKPSDEYVGMVARKLLSLDFAEVPLDFNEAGQVAAISRISPSLEPTDYVLDIGCSSGEFALHAAERTNFPPTIIGLDPDGSAYTTYLEPRLTDEERNRFFMIEGRGEQIPLNTGSVRVASAHNTVYRANNLVAMINEMKRVTVPGGLVIISTNDRQHARRRHGFERMSARRLSDVSGVHIKRPHNPAEKCYWTDLPTIVENVGGLVKVEEVFHNTQSVITPDRVEDYIMAIALSTGANGVPPALEHEWRSTVKGVVEPEIYREFNRIARQIGVAELRPPDKDAPILIPPQYDPRIKFTDPVARGMMVFVNQ